MYRQVLQVPKILCVEPCMDALSSGSDVTRSHDPQGDWANGAKNGKGIYLYRDPPLEAGMPLVGTHGWNHQPSGLNQIDDLR